MSLVEAPNGAATATWEQPGLVSVVINFLDAEPFLEEAITSVYSQSYPHWELLLVDDGSTDGSTAIARQRAEQDPARVRYIEHPGHENRGASAARNLGMSAARGEFVAFLDADDVWLPERLERAVDLLGKHPAAQMVYGESEYWYNWAGSSAHCPDRVQPHGFDADRVVEAPELLIRYLTHAAALPCMNSLTVRRTAALSCGGFVESFPGMHDDQAFLARFCLHHDVYVAQECWDRYRQHESSLCATTERRGGVDAARLRYLDWLKGFLLEQQVSDARVWHAMRYAEQAERYKGPGLFRRLRRMLLKLGAAARLSMPLRG